MERFMLMAVKKGRSERESVGGKLGKSTKAKAVTPSMIRLAPPSSKL